MAHASTVRDARPAPPSFLLLLTGWLDDPALRYAIKFGLAGILALFVTLVLRTPEPTWALFTVYVLMIAQYVGAIAEKSVFRLIGTVAGGVIGYVLTASLEQQPWIFLPAVGLVAAFSTAMFGQNRYPYAFLLCGLTTVVVTSNGMNNPDLSWTYMLWRIQEVSIGIVSAVVVQCLLWPRYAREEFGENARAAFADLRECFATSASALFEGGRPDAIRHAENFPARISGLRGLLDFGARESQYFRQRLPSYFEITTCLSRIASAIVTLGAPLPPHSLYRTAASGELLALHRALEAALENLSQKEATSTSRQVHGETVEDAFQALEEKLTQMRSHPDLPKIQPEEAIAVGVHALALDDIRRQIARAHELLDSLPEHPGEPSREIESFVSPIPPTFWVLSGIKSGIAVIAALLVVDWFNPPGANMLVLGAWVFTAMNAASPGGQGDRRAFDYALTNILALIVLCLLLILGSPLLSSYAVMNVVIFTWLFVWGYLSYSTRGMTIPMQLGMLASVGILGLNGQKPVPFNAIVGLFFGLVLAQLLAAVVQRVFWPSLPQWELRDRMASFLEICRRIVKEGPDGLPFWLRARIALIPGEAMQRISVMNSPICPPGETDRLHDYLLTLRRIGSHLTATIGKLKPVLRPEHAEAGEVLIARLESALSNKLQAHEDGIRHSHPPASDEGRLATLLDEWTAWAAQMRQDMLRENVPVLQSLRIMGLAGRYEQAGQDLLQADQQAAQLRLAAYMGDYVL